MIVFRRRLIFWIIKAYFRKWGRTIAFFFVLGLIVFFILHFAAGVLPSSFPLFSRITIGMTGAYTVNDLPPSVLEKVSIGLTKVTEDGKIIQGVASSYKIKDNKQYTFYLKKDVYFSDGTPLTSKEINYNFSEASVDRPDEYTIVFKLKDSYSPFLVTVSRPIFKKGFVGVGNFKIKDINLNGNFVSSIDLSPVRGKIGILKYIFYPTEDSLKTAFVLGEVSEIQGIHNLDFKDKKLSDFKKNNITKNLDQEQLVTLFYNTQDSILSDKKIRNAFSYAMPGQFDQGQRNSGPFGPSSWANSSVGDYIQDLESAKDSLSSSVASSSSSLEFVLKTLPQYADVAEKIKQELKKIDINLKIEETDVIPNTFQMFLGDFNLSKDPDQYALWHSGQNSNITKYKNLRIDKLLEDGRKIVNQNERKSIYSDFQKYLLDDSPATFLYLPYTYTVSRD